MRIPPHNLDAERAVLGAILLEGRETLPRVIELLKPSDFYTEAHRLTYQGMLALFNRSEPVDVLTLTEELRRGDQLEIVGGPAALALLVEQGSISAYLNSYAAIVRDMAVLRELIQTSSQIIAQAFEAKEDVQTLVDDAERRIFGLAERRLEGSALADRQDPPQHLRVHRAPVRAEGARHRRRNRLREARSRDLGLPALGLHHHRGKTEYGQSPAARREDQDDDRLEINARIAAGRRAGVGGRPALARERDLSSGCEAGVPRHVLGRALDHLHRRASLARSLSRLARGTGARDVASRGAAPKEALSASTLDRRALRRFRSLGGIAGRSICTGRAAGRRIPVGQQSQILDRPERDARPNPRARRTRVRAASRGRLRLAHRADRWCPPPGRSGREPERAHGRAARPRTLGEARRVEVHPRHLSGRVAR